MSTELAVALPPERNAVQLELIGEPPDAVAETQASFLTETDREKADELLAKNPEVGEALREFSHATEGYIGAFRRVVVTMRDAAIIGRECQSVLARAGWTKVRISEAKRIIEADEKTFKRFAKSLIGVRLALAEARQTLPESEGRAYSVPALREFFTKMVNGYNGPQAKKRFKFNAERLDCRFEFIVKPIKRGKKDKHESN
ncbi:MAG: hypothetical protein HZA93_15030 [Verrucomicrobia bacterium]|nr:hypothetical protein [Verrucomicrobiota bacterium]